MTPAELAVALGALEARVETAHVERSAVSLPDYPGGLRPSGVVRLSGGGATGLGENVAFFGHEQERFSAFIAAWLRGNAKSRRLRVGCAVGAEGTPYERAALEAALIDLGLRQAGLSLCDLTGARAAKLRFVVSLAASREPESAIVARRAAGAASELKIDVDPSWSAATLARLAKDPNIAIFDFKARGSAALAQRLYALSASALLEDPPSGFEAPERELRPLRISRDATVSDEHAVAAARARGEAVNLKAPRMGGPLELLRGLDRALAPSRHPRAAGVPAYFGGMFEVGVGRSQARQLAALYCSAAPNDLALNRADQESTPETRASSPTLIRLDGPGFGH